jgi:hypothetical protein
MFRKELDRMDQEKEEAARMFRWENVRLKGLSYEIDFENVDEF